MKQEKYMIKLSAEGHNHEVIAYSYDDEVDDDELRAYNDLQDNFTIDVSTDTTGLRVLKDEINDRLNEKENVMFALIGYYKSDEDRPNTEIIFEDSDLEVVKKIRDMIDEVEERDLTELENRGIVVEFIDDLHTLGIYKLKIVKEK